MVHGKGMGGIDDSDVERRANQLASLAGRAVPTGEDFAQAKSELLGKTLPGAVTEDSPTIARGVTRDPSEPPSDPGRQVPERAAPDEETSAERLVEEGVEEAQHDQMIAAQRKQHHDERKET